jgi:hypothetical protein
MTGGKPEPMCVLSDADIRIDGASLRACGRGPRHPAARHPCDSHDPAQAQVIAPGASNTAGRAWGHLTHFRRSLRRCCAERHQLACGQCRDFRHTTAGMLARLSSAVPAGTKIVILQFAEGGPIGKRISSTVKCLLWVIFDRRNAPTVTVGLALAAERPDLLGQSSSSPLDSFRACSAPATGESDQNQKPPSKWESNRRYREGRGGPATSMFTASKSKRGSVSI